MSTNAPPQTTTTRRAQFAPFAKRAPSAFTSDSLPGGPRLTGARACAHPTHAVSPPQPAIL